MLFWTHATHGKNILTHFFTISLTLGKFLWNHVIHATHAKIWPMNSRYPRHPHYLADSMMLNGKTYRLTELAIKISRGKATKFSKLIDFFWYRFSEAATKADL